VRKSFVSRGAVGLSAISNGLCSDGRGYDLNGRPPVNWNVLYLFSYLTLGNIGERAKRLYVNNGWGDDMLSAMAPDFERAGLETSRG
jgi:hypothetical protein